MSDPRLTHHHKLKRADADRRMLEQFDRDADRQHYADLLKNGKANLDTIRQLNEIGRRLGKSAEQIELDVLTLAREAGSAK